MNLRHLRYFLVVAEELHFSRAAERLNIDQSPLSRSIKELEQKLGADLFDRNTRNTQLTSAGKVFLEHVPKVFLALERSKDAVQSLGRGNQQQLRIAQADFGVSARLTVLLRRCYRQFPSLDIRLFETNESLAIQGLQEGEYDAGFSHTAVSTDLLTAEHVLSEPLVVVLSQSHPLLRYDHISLDKLKSYPLICGDPIKQPGYVAQISEILMRTIHEPIIAGTASTSELIFAQVAAGKCVGVIAISHFYENKKYLVSMRPLDVKDAVLNTYIIRRSSKPGDELEYFIVNAKKIALGFQGGD